MSIVTDRAIRSVQWFEIVLMTTLLPFSSAIAQVGGEVERVFSLDQLTRDAALDQAKAEAVDKAVAAGATPQRVRIVDVDDVPLPYLPGNATRIKVKAVGELELGRVAVA